MNPDNVAQLVKATSGILERRKIPIRIEYTREALVIYREERLYRNVFGAEAQEWYLVGLFDGLGS